MIGCALAAGAQQAEPVIFRERSFDFGNVQESQGNVDHEFIFTNNSGRPLRITGVKASCGCTTPAWTNTVIPAGKTGFVKASFDPRGRPGYFNKTLTVQTDLENGEVVLQIKGHVVSANGEEAQPGIAMGTLKFNTRYFNVGKVYTNREVVVRDFPVLNAGSSVVRFKEVMAPEYVKVQTPQQLHPQEKGEIRITYDGRKRNQLGFYTDNITLLTDDPAGESKSITVFATIEEYYPRPTPEEQAKAPVLSIRVPVVDLGRYESAVTIEKDVYVLNSGKRDLMIKALQPNCSCVTAAAMQNVVHPGDSAAIKVVFTPQKRIGTQQKAVTIYSNDPRSPVQMIQLQVFIER